MPDRGRDGLFHARRAAPFRAARRAAHQRPRGDRPCRRQAAHDAAAGAGWPAHSRDDARQIPDRRGRDRGRARLPRHRQDAARDARHRRAEMRGSPPVRGPRRAAGERGGQGRFPVPALCPLQPRPRRAGAGDRRAGRGGDGTPRAAGAFQVQRLAGRGGRRLHADRRNGGNGGPRGRCAGPGGRGDRHIVRRGRLSDL